MRSLTTGPPDSTTAPPRTGDLKLLTTGLPGTAAARLLAAIHDPTTRSEGYLVDPPVVAADLAEVTEIIDA